MKLTKEEKEYLAELLLREMEENQKIHEKFKGFLKREFYEIDEFIHNLYKKINEAKI